MGNILCYDPVCPSCSSVRDEREKAHAIFVCPFCQRGGPCPCHAPAPKCSYCGDTGVIASGVEHMGAIEVIACSFCSGGTNV